MTKHRERHTLHEHHEQEEKILSSRSRHLLRASLVLVALAHAIYYVAAEFSTNGAVGFPLDDPWIHLTFARTLADAGRFAYSPLDAATAGSTSPLFTFLLALGWLLVHSEIWIGIVTGSLFFILTVLGVRALVSELLPKKEIIAFAAAAVFACEPHTLGIMLSGMETTLAMAASVWVMVWWHRKKITLFALGAGSLLWIRPDLGILLVALAFEFFYNRWIDKMHGWSGTEIKRILIIAAPLALLYFGMNLALSGSFLPNTFTAKRIWYEGADEKYWKEVWQYFTRGMFLPIAIGVGAAFISLGITIVRKEKTFLLAPLVWFAGVILAYKIVLPEMYQDGRYVMPVIPAFIVLGVIGAGKLVRGAERTITKNVTAKAERIGALSVSILAIVIAFTLYKKNCNEFVQNCRYITERQVNAAHWLHDNTPADAVIGTHDIGAIGFYSGRTLADMAGLVSPDMLSAFGNLEAMKNFLRSHHVTHLALLPSWFDVSNVDVLYETDPRWQDVMRVYPFSESVHFLPSDVRNILFSAEQLLAQNQPREAERYAREAVKRDPANAKAHAMLATIFANARNLPAARRELGETFALHSSSREGRFAAGAVALASDSPNVALTHWEEAYKQFSSNRQLVAALARLATTLGDSAKAAQYSAALRSMTTSQ